MRPADGALSRFRLTPNGDGTLRIRNVHSQRCVDLYGASSAEDAKVATWGCTTADNQKWRALANPAGGVSFRSVSSGKCLATKGADTAVGTELAQTTCAISPTQRWELVPQVAPVEEWAAVVPLPLLPRTLKQQSSGLYAATSVAGLDANVLALSESAVLSGQFTFTPDASGAYRIRNVARGTCIDVYGGSTRAGGQVGTWACDASSVNQQWRVLTNPAGGISLRSVRSGLCLASKDDAVPPGTILVQKTCGYDRAQRWSIDLL